MIYPGDFQRSLRDGSYRPEDKRVMARVALNALVDPHRYPVDISEISRLRYDARALTRALLAFLATNPVEYGTWSATQCDIFFEAMNKTPSRDAQLEGASCM